MLPNFTCVMIYSLTKWSDLEGFNSTSSEHFVKYVQKLYKNIRDGE